jgi:hypothetical protein
VLIIPGIASLVTGLGLATYALFAREEVFVRSKPAALQITPVVSPRLAGGALRVAF